MAKLILSVLFIVVSLYLCNAQQWIPVSAEFGPYPIPFRYGHSGGITPFGRIVTFSGVTESSAIDQYVQRFNYLSDGNILVLQQLNNLRNNPRVYAAFGLWQSNYLVTYGGNVGSGTTAPPYLLIYDISNGAWLNDTSSFQPQPNDSNIENHYKFPSWGAAAAIDDSTNNLYLFGGNAVAFVLNFVTRVNLTSQTYYQIHLDVNSAVSPNRKYGAVMAFTNNPTPQLWMFGGKSGIGTEGSVQTATAIYNEMSNFDINANKWIDVSASPANNGKPSARAWMASLVMNDKYSWIIFGGRNDFNKSIGVQTLYNDIYKFNLITKTWVSFTVTGTAPSIRDKSVFMLLNWAGEDSALLYGGSDQNFSPFNDFWYLKINSTGTPPIPPPSTLDISSDANGDVVVLPTPSPSTGISPSASAVPPLVTVSSAVELTSWISFAHEILYSFVC